MGKIISHKKYNFQTGFTLIELLVVISIIGLLSSVVLVSMNSARLKARDGRRLSDMRQIQTALELYYDKNKQYPNPACDPLGNCSVTTCSGWDSSGDGEFIIALKNDGILSNSPMDPRNSPVSCGTYHYRYYRYGADVAGNCDPCQGRAYYVIGFNTSESITGVHPKSPGWSCNIRNWQGEFSWVVGKCE